MDTPTSNSTTPSSPPHRHRALGRWALIFPIALMLVGGLIVSYPLWPAIGFAVSKPTPTFPYATKIASTPTGTAAVATLSELPVIGHQPTPAENRVVIPSIGVNMEIFEGPNEKTLDQGGIWHIPNTSSPDRGGNTVFSGHRWRYLPPSNSTLYLLDKVKDGEPVIVYWRGKEYDYRISGRAVVDPSRVEILENTTTPKLTIFTCTPLYSTKQRLVLYGELIL